MTISSVTNNLIIIFGQNDPMIDFSEVLVYAEQIEDHYISHHNSPGIFQS
jgi:hypothetical protein